ncbi:MAG: hypothetical protein F9K24_20595 [Leptonema illini]|uniref:Lipoprotein n=1 Tax=Leptonema illini TaxID=183 RepID=A0A833GXU7_9LEPT|nr:MAG: hypothetical protein F9K24_20595 [Leptonema illini]
MDVFNEKRGRLLILLQLPMLVSCTTLITLGRSSSLTEGTKTQIQETVCLESLNNGRVFPETRQFGTFLSADAFFSDVFQEELSKHFYTKPMKDCLSESFRVLVSMEDISFHRYSIGSIIPVVTASTNVTVSIQFIQNKQDTSSAIIRSDIIEGTMGSSDLVLALVARAAIRDATMKSVQYILCKKSNRTSCQSVAPVKRIISVTSMAEEYKQMQLQGEPFVFHYLWSIPRTP